MDADSSFSSIGWERYPKVAADDHGRAWLAFQANRGLAPNTLDAYGRNLDAYLGFLALKSAAVQDSKPSDIALYLRQLASQPCASHQASADGTQATLANANHDAVRAPERPGPGRQAGAWYERDPRVPHRPHEGDPRMKPTKWSWPLDLARYDRSPGLTLEERSALRRLPPVGASYSLSKALISCHTPRLTQPLDVAFDYIGYSRGSRPAVSILLLDTKWRSETEAFGVGQRRTGWKPSKSASLESMRWSPRLIFYASSTAFIG